jgi:hypothetical protein
MEDGLGRAHGHAHPATDAFIGMDVEGALAFIDAVDGTALNAGAVLDVDAWGRDDISH